VAARYLPLIPAGGSHLERYGRSFPVAEIDSSFYRHHKKETYARWAHSVGRSFRFSVKIPRELTHEGRLVCEKNAALDRFLAEVAGLGRKLGVLLAQLPPGLPFERTDTMRFFRRLRRGVPDTVALVCEPRHASWGTPDVQLLLDKLGVSRAAVDPPRWGSDSSPGGYGGLAYFRLHGSPRIYYSDYEPARLADLALQLKQASQKSNQVWCIFDNTAHGHAIGNALSLQGTLAATFR
jgi:uncharacterized protein YecE (DUF72 family)